MYFSGKRNMVNKPVNGNISFTTVFFYASFFHGLFPFTLFINRPHRLRPQFGENLAVHHTTFPRA